MTSHPHDWGQSLGGPEPVDPLRGMDPNVPPHPEQPAPQREPTRPPEYDLAHPHQPAGDPRRADDERRRPVAVDHPAEPVTERQAPEPEAKMRAKNESIGDLFASFSTNLSTLFRQEVELAKAEAKESAKKAGTGAGMLAGAGVAALLLLIFISLALMFALGEAMHLGLAALIVAVIWGVIAAALAMVGKKRFEDIEGLEQTQETLQEIPPTLNPSKETP